MENINSVLTVMIWLSATVATLSVASMFVKKRQFSNSGKKSWRWKNPRELGKSAIVALFALTVLGGSVIGILDGYFVADLGQSDPATPAADLGPEAPGALAGGVFRPAEGDGDLRGASSANEETANPNKANDANPSAANQVPEDEIPSVVNLTREELEVAYAEFDQWYVRMCDASMARTRAELTGIGDAFAVQPVLSQADLDRGTFWERSGKSLTLASALNVEPDIDELLELIEEYEAKLAKMTLAEQSTFINSRLSERLIGSPQYQLAFCALAHESPLILKNNAALFERYTRFVEECNDVAYDSFSPDFQAKFKNEDEYKAFRADMFREPTDEELAAGRMDYGDYDTELVNQFFAELAEMPLGIDKMVQYDPNHPGDIRYLMVTDEVREFGMRFAVIASYMPSRDRGAYPTIKSWTTPVVQADPRLLQVIECDYQENIADENGNIKHVYTGWWRDFPLKDSARTNLILWGINDTDGRLMLAKPDAKPVKPTPDTPTPPTPTQTKTAYKLTVICKDLDGNWLTSYEHGWYAAGVNVTITAPPISGYVYYDGAGTITMPARDHVVVLRYVQDSHGAKDTGPSSQLKPANGTNSGQNNSTNGEGSPFVNSEQEAQQDVNHLDELEKFQNDQANADKEAQDKADQKKDDVTQAAEEAREEAQQQGQGDTVTVEGGTPPDTSTPIEITPPECEGADGELVEPT